MLDLLGSACGLVVLSPLLGLAALAVRLSSPGPVFHRAKRIGLGARPFFLYKFRSMVEGAASQGPGITPAEDPRITRIGRLLRKTKIDELPQLINVLKGEMSLVGPRPEDPRYVALYSEEQRQILRVRPGMTSAASLAFKNEQSVLVGEDWERAYTEEVMPRKLAIDLEYLQNRTLWSDIRLVVRTIFEVTRR